jgi:hypothetical protein
MKKLSVICLLLVAAYSASAQKKKNPYLKQTTSEAGIVLSTNGGLSALSLSGIQYWQVGRKQPHIKIGLGGRLTSSFGGADLTYITAPAILTSGKTGPGVFFSDQVTQNIDTLKLASTQINALNVFLALRYDFKKKWSAEFNIDLAGFSFGGTKSSVLTYGEQSDATRTTDAKPSPRNALLVSDNDIGSLNSELMISYQYKPKIRLKAGASFLFNEYTVNDPVLYTNSTGTVVGTDRYRVKSLCVSIGANYIFKHKK